MSDNPPEQPQSAPADYVPDPTKPSLPAPAGESAPDGGSGPGGDKADPEKTGHLEWEDGEIVHVSTDDDGTTTKIYPDGHPVLIFGEMEISGKGPGTGKGAGTDGASGDKGSTRGGHGAGHASGDGGSGDEKGSGDGKSSSDGKNSGDTEGSGRDRDSASGHGKGQNDQGTDGGPREEGRSGHAAGDQGQGAGRKDDQDHAPAADHGSTPTPKGDHGTGQLPTADQGHGDHDAGGASEKGRTPEQPPPGGSEGADTGNVPPGGDGRRSPPERPRHEEGLGSFVEGALLGRLSDNSSWSAVAGQVVAGFVPYLGQLADARDIGADLGRIAAGDDDAIGDLLIDAAGIVPGLDALKGVGRAGRQASKAGAEIEQAAAKAAGKGERAAAKATGKGEQAAAGAAGRPDGSPNSAPRGGGPELPASSPPKPSGPQRPDVPTRSILPRNKITGPPQKSKARGYERRSTRHRKGLGPKRWDPEGHGPKDLDIGHVEKPHAMLKPGEQAQVTPQPKPFNNWRSHLEKKEVERLRRMSERLGLDSHDPVTNPHFYTRPPRGK